MVCDYFSNFIEVEWITKSSMHGVMKVLKTMFARYGTPDVLISDNGLRFDSTEFASFAKTWKFQTEQLLLIILTPMAWQKTQSRLTSDYLGSSMSGNQSEYLVLLNWCNMPSESIGIGIVEGPVSFAFVRKLTHQRRTMNGGRLKE